MVASYQTHYPNGSIDPAEAAWQREALTRFLRRECPCGAPRPIGDVLCLNCRHRVGLLNEVARRAEGNADDCESDVVAQVTGRRVVACRACAGTGVVEEMEDYGLGYRQPYRRECEACGGTGTGVAA